MNNDSLDILQAFSELGVDSATLSWSVFIVGVRELRAVNHQLGGEHNLTACTVASIRSPSAMPMAERRRLGSVICPLR